MIEIAISIGAAIVGGAIAYGDLRAKIGKLEGKIDLITNSMKMIMKNNGVKK